MAPVLSAGASLLQQARVFKGLPSHYGANRENLRPASVGLVQALVQGGQLDLSAPVTDDPQCPDLPLPAAWMMVENLHADRLQAWVELDPGCLRVETARGPSFKIAVEASLARVGEGKGAYPGSSEDEDEALAVWARHIPVEHCLVFDEPGDDPGSGLLTRLRTSGHYPALEEELARKGLDLDGCRADGTPTSISIHAQPQWDAWLESGGDPRKIVPAADGVAAMAVWDYQGLRRPGQLLPQVQQWASTVPASDPLRVRVDHHVFWHTVDCAAQKDSRDEFVNALKQFPDWEKRTDDAGRCVLFRVLRQQPAFLNSCLERAAWKIQLQHRDHAGRGVWHYAALALLGYNREKDAKSMAAKLAKIEPATASQFDGDRARGLLMSAILRDIKDPLPPPPSGNSWEEQNKYSRLVRAREPSYGKLPLTMDAMFAGSAEEQRQAATHLMSFVSQDRASMSIAGAVAGYVASQLVQRASDSKMFSHRAASALMEPELKAALAYMLLCPRQQTSSSHDLGALATSSIMPLLQDWANQGMCLPGDNGRKQLAHLEKVWASRLATSYSGRDPPRPAEVQALFDVWGRFEDTAQLERETAPVESRPRGPRL